MVIESISSAPGQTRKVPLRVWFWRQFFSIPHVDRMLRRRAADLFAKAHMGEYLTKADSFYLDIGSGSGHMLEEAVRLTSHLAGMRYMGVDPSWRPLGRVERRINHAAPGRFEFARTGGEKLDLPDRTVDAAWLCFVLHHVPYNLQDGILGELKRLLKPGGVFFLFEDTPSNRQEWRRVERWDRIQNFEPPSEKHYYRSGEDWRRMFASTGFSQLREAAFDKMIPQLGMAGVPHHAMVFQVQ
ncbi:MAG: class I SAM-dependent methyltransferase [Planctomycetes bacterium]|nr:class I SAM-dependent methyltransferase [Planctomycetota bacterium]